MKKIKKYSAQRQMKLLDNLLDYYTDKIEFELKLLTYISIPLTIFAIGSIFSIRQNFFSNVTGSFRSYVIKIILLTITGILLFMAFTIQKNLIENKERLRYFYVLKQRNLMYGKADDKGFIKFLENMESKILFIKEKNGKRYMK